MEEHVLSVSVCITNVYEQDSGNYTCIARNIAGTQVSTAANLIVYGTSQTPRLNAMRDANTYICPLHLHMFSRNTFSSRWRLEPVELVDRLHGRMHVGSIVRATARPYAQPDVHAAGPDEWRRPMHGQCNDADKGLSGCSCCSHDVSCMQ